MNLLDYKKTPLFDVYQAVSELAVENRTKVIGSEIIGLVPLSALLDTGKFVCSQVEAADKNSVNEQSLIDHAIKFLNLNQYQSFIAREKVLEYRLADCKLYL